jgi:hypothetical protein
MDNTVAGEQAAASIQRDNQSLDLCQADRRHRVSCAYQHGNHHNSIYCRDMKAALEILSETSAAAAAILWFMSARVRLRKRSLLKHGLASGLDDPRALLRLVYEQSQWSAWAAIAAGVAAIFAIADGFAR